MALAGESLLRSNFRVAGIVATMVNRLQDRTVD